MSYIIRIRDFLVYTNIFIGSCALALTWETFILLRLPATLNWYLLLIFGATLFIYNLHYYAKLSGSKDDSRLHWCRQHKKLMLGFVLGSFLFILGGVFWHRDAIFGIPGHWHTRNLIIFLIIPLLAIGYTFPIFPKKKSLRQIGWLKMISLSFIWTFSTLLLPLLLDDSGSLIYFSWWKAGTLFIQRFIFIAALSLLFNINDHEEDLRDGIRTFAVALGPEQSLRRGKWLMTLLNTVSLSWVLFEFRLLQPAPIAASALFLTILFRAFDRFRPDPLESRFVIRYDGLMLIQALLLIFAISIFK